MSRASLRFETKRWATHRPFRPWPTDVATTFLSASDSQLGAHGQQEARRSRATARAHQGGRQRGGHQAHASEPRDFSGARRDERPAQRRFSLPRRATQRMPTVSVDTVYRTLWMLHDLGLVTTLGPQRVGVRFDANPAQHHYVCARPRLRQPRAERAPCPRRAEGARHHRRRPCRSARRVREVPGAAILLTLWNRTYPTSQRSPP